jgi:hypothetical protein
LHSTQCLMNVVSRSCVDAFSASVLPLNATLLA